ncbi:MAG: class I SAM-dependent methyltransferase [Candidatus Saccharimonadales bacterium]
MGKQDLREQTVDTYNKLAKELAEYLRGIDPRTKDIDFALQAAGNGKQSRVLEIGCGNGRDAKYIVGKVDWYQGFDISEELIKLAREHVPGGKFEVADAVNFHYPENLDVIFAFASLLHLDEDEVRRVIQNAALALKPGGIFYISLKCGSEYLEWVKQDKFGTRFFITRMPRLSQS